MLKRVVTWKSLATVVGVVVLAFAYRSLLEEGHDWGDDFSLYINQARALVRGDIPQVVADTRYTLQNSGADSFSPYVYPWGLPLLLAPVYLVAGIDYSAFAWVTVGSFIFFLWAFRRLVAPGIGTVPSYLVTAVIAASVPYARSTGAILSDLPAIASVAGALMWFEHCRSAGHFAKSTRHAMVTCGLAVTWAFSLRRESVMLLLALFAVQFVALRSERRAAGDTARPGFRWTDVTAPYWSFALSAGAFHLILPASLEQQTVGAGIHNIRGNLEWYRSIFAELVGLKEIGDNPIAWFGNARVGSILLMTVVVFALIGVGVAAGRRRGPELSIVVYFLAVSWLILTQSFREGRYIYGLAPFVLYFAWLGTSELVAPVRSGVSKVGRVTALLPGLLIVPLLVSNLDGFEHAWSYHREYDYVVRGPATASSQEMFEAVKRCTRGDDVVLFARARAMNLYTNRRTIQTGNVTLGLERADWMMLSNDDVDYYEPKVNEANYREYGLRKVWQNDEFTLYGVGVASTRPADPCPPLEP